MRFGLQKLTLLDFPGQVACTIFCKGCNYRCPFCHNASLVEGDGELPYTAQDIVDFLKKRTGILDGICLTGGEPLLTDEMLEVAAEAKKLGYLVKLDTNGSFPERLKRAVDKKMVDYVAMDIKAPQKKYAAVCGNSTVLDAVRESVDFLKSKPIAFEFRTTVAATLHEVGDFAEIGKWIAGTERYYLQPFADSGDILGGDAAIYKVTDEFVQECLLAAQKYVPAAAIRGR